VNILKKIQMKFFVIVREEGLELDENRPLAENDVRIHRFPWGWNRIAAVHKKIGVCGCGQGGKNADQAVKKDEKWDSSHELIFFRRKEGKVTFGHTSPKSLNRTQV
jgi:hypothetical protein